MGTFIEDCLRTESTIFNINSEVDQRLIHVALGMQTESAEFSDALKKYVFYGKELDLVNLKEELGDMMWYMAIAFDALGTTFEEEQSRVINKLKTRYPDKFTSEAAENRNLAEERRVLEAGHFDN